MYYKYSSIQEGSLYIKWKKMCWKKKNTSVKKAKISCLSFTLHTATLLLMVLADGPPNEPMGLCNKYGLHWTFFFLFLFKDLKGVIRDTCIINVTILFYFFFILHIFKFCRYIFIVFYEDFCQGIYRFPG